MTKKNFFKNIFKIKRGVGKRILIRSKFITGGLTAGVGLGMIAEGTPTGQVTLAGTLAGVVVTQHLASQCIQGKFPCRPKTKKKVKH